MRHGSPPYELSETDPARFGAWADRAYAVAMARKTYGLGKATLISATETDSSEHVLTSRTNHEMFDLLRTAGAQFEFKSGWQVIGFCGCFVCTHWLHSICVLSCRLC